MNAFSEMVSDWLPPVARGFVKWCKDIITNSGFFYFGSRWPEKVEKGWSDDAVVESRRRLFLEWRESVGMKTSLGTVGYQAKATPVSIEIHNRYMSFSCVLGLVAHDKKKLKVMDWGGACGDYLLLAKKLFPSVVFEWHCAEVPSICRLGREVNPDVRFYDNQAEWESQKFDFCHSSSALQYVADWPRVLRTLAASSTEWLFITRIPIVYSVSSYVFTQRNPSYRTEYLGWALNHRELVDEVVQGGFTLSQEFLLGRWERIHGSPEQPVNMGFLFRKIK